MKIYLDYTEGGMSLNQIARKYNITAPRVWVIVQNAYKKIEQEKEQK